MEGAPAAAAPARHPYRAAALVLAGAVAVVAVAAAALYGWLGRYAPLAAGTGFAPGPGLTESGSRTPGLLVPAGERRTFDTAFSLRNTGRFAVTIEGIERGQDAPAPLRLLATDSATASAEPGHLHRFRALQLGPGDGAILVVRWHVVCGNGGTARAVRLRYSYLSLFERTQRVALPFTVALRCAPAP